MTIEPRVKHPPVAVIHTRKSVGKCLFHPTAPREGEEHGWAVQGYWLGCSEESLVREQPHGDLQHPPPRGHASPAPRIVCGEEPRGMEKRCHQPKVKELAPSESFAVPAFHAVTLRLVGSSGEAPGALWCCCPPHCSEMQQDFSITHQRLLLALYRLQPS